MIVREYDHVINEHVLVARPESSTNLPNEILISIPDLDGSPSKHQRGQLFNN